MLKAEHLTRKYANTTAVDDISFTLNLGQTCALLGPNGSGKTTLMKMIAGLIQPTSGEILFEDMPIGVKTKARIAYMPTENYFYNYMTVRDAGVYYADFFHDFDLRKFKDMIEQMNLREKDKIRSLSSGMSAKLRLALTLSRDADLMMFDEPLNGVDILTRAQVVNAIAQGRSEGRMMLISTHLIDELEPYIDSAIYMDCGKIVASGTKDELTSEYTLTERYLRIYGGEREC